MAAMRPPFLAAGLPELRKKIETGVCDRIPAIYSQDLDAFVRLCMAPSPKDRPSAEELLHNPLIRKQLYRFPN